MQKGEKMFSYLLLAFIIVPFVYWFYSKSEEVNKTKLRILKIFSFCSAIVVLYYIAFIASFGYNYRYNHSAKILTESIIECIERGDSELAVKELKKFNETITPTYMNTNFIKNAKLTSENLKKIKTNEKAQN